MDILRALFGMKKLKPYKIQDSERHTRFGIAATSLNDLKEKACAKLKIKGPISIVLEEDGTSIDSEEYFQSLPAQTVFVLLKPEQEWDGYITYLRLAMEKMSENIMAGNQTIKEILDVFQSENAPEMSVLVDYVNNLQANIAAEEKFEDPEWFEGAPSQFNTKDKVMRYSAKTRIRGYFSKTCDFIRKANLTQKDKKTLEQITDKFQAQLRQSQFHSSYFSRKANKKDSFCTSKGWFYCEGPYSADGCFTRHAINPYGTKDSRVLFSTWNLDHRIEKNREIVPKLIEAVVNCPKNKEINWKYFHQLLFTKTNLGLVEIRCHLKEKHGQMQVDLKKAYLSV